MIETAHPASSVDFLSRLHDGEISPAERIEFESHREQCAACGNAVAEFERSLAAFRMAPTAPVPSDLSARILRKIRAQSPSRRPFGVMFGIDIRLAGVLTAALLVAIIAPALFFRREAPQAVREPAAISAYVVEGQSDKEIVPPNPPAAAPKNAAKALEPKARENARADSAASGPPGETRAESAPVVSAEAPLAEKPQAAPETLAPRALAKRDAISSSERAGGEAGFLADEESDSEKVHLVIQALDGGGQPPAVAAAPSNQRLAPLRGRQFILIVEASGRVRDVNASKTEDQMAARQKDALQKAEPSADPARDLLRELRFQPEGRPRRLLVRVQ